MLHKVLRCTETAVAKQKKLDIYYWKRCEVYANQWGKAGDKHSDCPSHLKMEEVALISWCATQGTCLIIHKGKN